MPAVAVFLAFLWPSLAAGEAAVTKVWVEPSDPRTVWGRLAGQGSVALFDSQVRTEAGYALPQGSRISGFSLPSLSPDGRRIAFKAAGKNSSAIGVYRLESSAARILDTDCDAKTVTWSPGGRYLAIEDFKGLLNNTVRVLSNGNEAS